MDVSDSLCLRNVRVEGSCSFSLGNEGIIVLYKPFDGGNTEWYWSHYDIHLKLIFDTIVAFPKKIEKYVSILANNRLLVFIQKNGSTESWLYDYEPNKRKLNSQAFYIPGFYEPRELFVVKNNIYLSAYGYPSSYVLGRLDISTKKFQVIPMKIKGTPSDMFISHDKQNDRILVFLRTLAKSVYTIHAIVLNADGNALSPIMTLPTEGKNTPSSAYLLKAADSSYLITGTYNEIPWEDRFGVYTCTMNLKSISNAKFISLTYFENFYNDVEETTRAKLNNRRKEQINKGVLNYSHHLLTEFGVYPMGDYYCYVAAKYEKFSHVKIHNVNLNSINLEWSSKESDGFLYSAMLVICFNNNGDVVWDQSTAISDPDTLRELKKISVIQSSGDVLRTHCVTTTSYSRSTFYENGGGQDEHFVFDNGKRMEQDERFYGYFNTPMIITDNKILMMGRMKSYPLRGLQIPQDELLVLYVITTF